MILDSFSVLPDEVERLTNNSFLNDKLKRTYLRIVKERIQRFDRKSEWKIFWLGDVSIHIKRVIGWHLRDIWKKEIRFFHENKDIFYKNNT